ncbi:MAG: serine/threonine-protein kinase [bacterium]
MPLGLFDLREAVGAGAMARVWRAEHRGLRVPVAVKVLTQAESPDVPILFAHEVRAVARLSHPAIIRLHDHGVIPTAVAEKTGLPDGAPFLIMEWLPGGSLRQRAGAMAWAEVRRTLLVLLDALAHAHARGVIHRDLKPDNVLLAERGPVLTDFGVAASLDEAQASRLLVGTPNYMAPEQIKGDWHALGPWTDLYAVGCLAWQLATGSAPFAGRGRKEVLRAHLHGDLPAFEPRIEVPAGFEGWVRALLAKHPAARPRFAAQAAAALVAAVGAEPRTTPWRW